MKIPEFEKKNKDSEYDEILYENLKKCLDILLNSKKITISTHMNPDGDAIGSTLAFYHYSLQKGIDAAIINHHKTPGNLMFLPRADNIRVYDKDRDDDYIMSSDAIFIIDVNDAARIKSLEEAILKSNVKKVVIDHHANPKEFADLYAIDTEACSAGEIIWKLFKLDKNFKLSPEIATSIYAAIMTDTGSFRFPRTDGEVHRIIGELVDAGADPVSIYENIYNIRPFKGVKLLGEAFAGMELFCDRRLCVMTLTKEHFLKTQAMEEDVEDIVEQSLTIKGVLIGILLTEYPGRNEIRLSLRSKGNLSVRDIAVAFNGGGHFHAAGARFYNENISDVRKKVIKKISELF